jgi:HEAT repeat protein
MRIYDFTEHPDGSSEPPPEPVVNRFATNALMYYQVEEAGDSSFDDPRLFYTRAIETLKQTDDPEIIEPIVKLLSANGLLLEAVCDRALSREQAHALARIAFRLDARADCHLARSLADSQTNEDAVSVSDVPRLLEVLCEEGDPARMMTSMLRLLRHSDPHVRTRAAKVVGRGSKSPKWVRQRLMDADPRMRANAVESLWSVDTAAARGLLRFAAREGGHNRVVANALLGLYYLGETPALAALATMATSECAMARSSAAWAMGETGDVRFQQALRRMLNDVDVVARKSAFRALARLNAMRPAAASALHVAATTPEIAAKGMRSVFVSVAGDQLEQQSSVPALGFVLSETDSAVTSHVLSYKVIRHPPPRPMSVVFVMPRQTEAAGQTRAAMESCLQWKRACDSWCFLPYLESGGGEAPEESTDPAPLTFPESVEALKTALSEATDRACCADLWGSLWRAAKLEASAHGLRHILLMTTVEEARQPGHGVAARVRDPRVKLQALAMGRNHSVQEFCREVGAPFQMAESAEIAESIRRAYLSLMARFEIQYQPVIPNAASLKVRVQSTAGAGEVTVRYPPRLKKEVLAGD